MTNIQISTLGELAELLNGIMSKLVRTGTEQTIGHYGCDRQMFHYICSHEKEHAELTFYPWIPDDHGPHEFDYLKRERNQICFVPTYNNSTISIEEITHIAIERQYRTSCWLWLGGEANFYEETVGSLKLRWSIPDSKLIQIKPHVMIDSPVAYVHEDGKFDQKLHIDQILQPYQGFEFIIDGDVCRWGKAEFPMNIDINEKINNFVNLERGIRDFVNCISH